VPLAIDLIVGDLLNGTIRAIVGLVIRTR